MRTKDDNGLLVCPVCGGSADMSVEGPQEAAGVFGDREDIEIAWLGCRDCFRGWNLSELRKKPGKMQALRRQIHIAAMKSRVEPGPWPVDAQIKLPKELEKEFVICRWLLG